ncbi:MAG: GGDEF domain-containing protein [Treponema sp.]|nr:GGDEF domain-containing protein [Treponema sp.]
MKKAVDIQNLIFKFLLILFLATGIYVLIAGRNTPSAQISQYEAKNFNLGWYYLDPDGKKIQIESLPAKIPVQGLKSTIYHNLTSYEDGRTSLCFYSEHQNVTVKINGQEIYSFKTQVYPKNLLSYRPLYNFMYLPPLSENSILSVETEALIPSSAGSYDGFLLGDSVQVLACIIFRYINNFLLGVMFIVISVFLFGTHHLFSHTNKKDYTLFYLALLTLTIGLWQLDDSNILLFFTGNQPLLWCLKYLTQLFLPIYTFLFVKSITLKEKSRFMNFLFWAIIAILAGQYILQFTGILALTNTVFASHFIYLLVCVYTLYSLSHEEWLKTSRLKYLFLLSMLASISIFAFTAFTLLNNKFFSSLMSFGLGLTFFSMILIAYQKELKVFESINQAETYKKLAFLDLATGVRNKSAWFTLMDSFSEENSDKNELCLILFDMNNLKKLNDNYGHIVGDQVIKSFSDTLLKVFSNDGEIYRIGGDEFVCLCPVITRERIQSLLYKFDEEILNQKENEYKFSAAYGFEYFKPKKPSDFQKALERADEKMYESKVSMKAGRK